MKKLNLLLLKSFIGPLLLTFFISLFILLMQFLWKYVDDLVGKGLDFIIIAKFLGYAAVTLVPMALPLAILLASLMTFGNLGENYELVAIKAAGISLGRTMRPLIITALLISSFAFFFSNNILPYSYSKYRSLLNDIQSKKPTLSIIPGEYYNKIDGYTIRIGSKGRDGKTIKNVQIYDHSDKKGNNKMTLAKHGTMTSTMDGKYLVFHLFDGHSYTEDLSESNSSSGTRPMGRAKFAEQILHFDISSFDFSKNDASFLKNHEKMQNLSQLQHKIDTGYIKLSERTKEISDVFAHRYYFLTNYYNDSIKKQHEASFAVSDLNQKSLENAVAMSDMNKKDAEYFETDVKYLKEHVAVYEVEWHRKFSLSFACLILFIIGAPLGAIIRKGGLGVPVVVSVFLFITFHVISMIGEKSAKSAEIPAWEGMWIASAVFLVIGIFLSYKAATDAPLMDADIWRKNIKKIFNRQ